MASRLKCPHCGYEPEYGVHVCQGCQSEIIYGYTQTQILQGGCAATVLGLLLTATFDISIVIVAALIAFVIGCGYMYSSGKGHVTFRRTRR